jgi:hypothetical protein
MICSSVNLLFFMSVILLVDGLPGNYAGTAGRGQVTATVRPAFGQLTAASQRIGAMLQ